MAALRNIVLYGAGGPNIGQAVLNAVVEDGTFNVSVLARKGSKTTYPASVKLLQISDDLTHAELVDALKGQDAVVSLVGTSGIKSQFKIIDAAIEAGVKRFIPSEYGFDNAEPKKLAMSPIFKPKGEVAQYLEAKVQQHPEFSYTAVATSIWTEWAINTKFIGVDPIAHTVTYWDEGTHKFSNTTLAYSGHSVVQTLKHPEASKNKRIFLEAFAASQRDIVAELERQQGQKYSVLPPTDGAQAVKNALKQWADSGETDYNAAYTTVTAALLVKEYGADFRANGEIMLEDLVEMPKVTLEDAVRLAVEGQ